MKKKNQIKTLFGANLKKYREQAGLTQNQLAEKISCNPKYLSEIETGKTFASFELMEDVISVLHIPISYLFASPDVDVKDFTSMESEINKAITEMSEKIKNILITRQIDN